MNAVDTNGLRDEILLRKHQHDSDARTVSAEPPIGISRDLGHILKATQRVMRAHGIFVEIKIAKHEPKLARAVRLPQSEFDKLIIEQEMRCAICGVEFRNTREIKTDHDHSTGKARGLLCNSCNVGLGHFRDKPNLLAAAWRYLEYHRGHERRADEVPPEIKGVGEYWKHLRRRGREVVELRQQVGKLLSQRTVIRKKPVALPTESD